MFQTSKAKTLPPIINFPKYNSHLLWQKTFFFNTVIEKCTNKQK